MWLDNHGKWWWSKPWLASWLNRWIIIKPRVNDKAKMSLEQHCTTKCEDDSIVTYYQCDWLINLGWLIIQSSLWLFFRENPLSHIVRINQINQIHQQPSAPGWRLNENVENPRSWMPFPFSGALPGSRTPGCRSRQIAFPPGAREAMPGARRVASQGLLWHGPSWASRMAPWRQWWGRLVAKKHGENHGENQGAHGWLYVVVRLMVHGWL